MSALFDWDDMDTASDVFVVSTPPPSARGLGKKVAGGGFEVGIVSLHVPEQGRFSFCGGAIGDGRKMCIKADCGVVAHQSKKVALGPELLGVDVLFIVATAPKGVTAVHVEPRLRSSKLGARLSFYLQEERTLDAWETLFRSVNAVDEEPSAEVLEFISDRMEERKEVENFGQTPRKKRPKLAVTSPALDAGFEVTLPNILDNLGTSNGEILSNLSSEWRNVVLSISTLTEMVQGFRQLGKDLARETQNEMEVHDFEIARLSNLMGTRGPNMSTRPVMAELEELGSTLDDLRCAFEPEQMAALVAFVATFRQDNGEGTKLGKDVKEDLAREFAPFVQLYRKLTLKSGTPGGAVLSAIQKLETEVKILQAAAPSSASVHSAGGFQWGLAASGLGGSTASMNADLHANSSHLGAAATGGGADSATSQKLEKRVQALEGRVQQGSAMEIMNVRFESLNFTKAWLLHEAPAAGAYIYFIDAHGLMAYMEDSTSDAKEIISMENHVAKAGYNSTEEGLLAASFRIGLPSFFGKDSSSNMASSDSRVLPAIRAATDWDPSGGFRGAKHRFNDSIKMAMQKAISGANNHLQGLALMVAQQTITMSFGFLDDLSKWMTAQYTDLKGRGSNPGDAWKLISHCVRAIFADLHDARLPGAGPFMTGDRPGGVVWGCLQALMLMSEYVRLGFAAHPKCSHILNIHLQDNAVMKVDYEKRSKMMMDTIDNLWSLVDKQATELSKLETRVGKLKGGAK